MTQEATGLAASLHESGHEEEAKEVEEMIAGITNVSEEAPLDANQDGKITRGMFL